MEMCEDDYANVDEMRNRMTRSPQEPKTSGAVCSHIQLLAETQTKMYIPAHAFCIIKTYAKI